MPQSDQVVSSFYRINVGGQWKVVFFNTGANNVTDTDNKARFFLKTNNGAYYTYTPGTQISLVHGGLYTQTNVNALYLCVFNSATDGPTKSTGNLADDSRFIKVGVLDDTDYARVSSLLDGNGKVLLSKLPDAVLGQLIFGGTISANTTDDQMEDYTYPSTNSEGGAYFNCTMTAMVRHKFNLTSTARLSMMYTIGYLATDQAKGASDCEGVFFISNYTGTLYYKKQNESLVRSLTIEKGDWLISNGTEWVRIDNTDAVRTVNGHIGDVCTLIDLHYTADSSRQKLAESHVGDIIRYNNEYYVVLSDNKTWIGALQPDVNTTAEYINAMLSGNIIEIIGGGSKVHYGNTEPSIIHDGTVWLSTVGIGE